MNQMDCNGRNKRPIAVTTGNGADGIIYKSRFRCRPATGGGRYFQDYHPPDRASDRASKKTPQDNRLL